MIFILTAWKAGLKTTYYFEHLVQVRLKNRRLMQRSLALLKNVYTNQWKLRQPAVVDEIVEDKHRSYGI